MPMPSLARDPMTADDVARAFDLAERVLRDVDGPTSSVHATLARALLRTRDVIARDEPVLGMGSRLRVSTKLLEDLHAMPDHESCTVRVARVEVGFDGVAVLVLLPDEVKS